jgi:tetratricopeptide (TPR) repeat protein
MIHAKFPLRIKARTGFLPAVTMLLIMSSAWGDEPMMDSGIFGTSRGGAILSVKEGKFSVAILAEEKALKIAQNEYGPLHPSLVPLYNDLATLHRYLADYGKSEKEYKWGLALLEKDQGSDDLQIADSLENLAALYNDLGRSVEAELAAKRALNLRETGASKDPQVLAQTQGLLGRIELSLHNHSQAQNLFRKALENLAKDPHADSALSLVFLGSLAQSYQSEQDYNKAQTFLEKALELAQKKFQANAIEVADAMELLADFFHRQGEEEKAKPLYASALKIDQHYVGTVYSYASLPYLKRLAKASLSAGDAKSSETLWQKSLQTEKEVFGPRHPQVALDLIYMAEVESVLKEKAKAQADLKESLKILKTHFSDDHPMVVLVHKRLE